MLTYPRFKVQSPVSGAQFEISVRKVDSRLGWSLQDGGNDSMFALMELKMLTDGLEAGGFKRVDE